MMKISLDEKRKILVVDDEKINRDILENILKDEYDIICASNGLDALNIIKNEDNISLILLDLLMPVMTGLEFLHEIKKYENNKNIPIIVITFSSEAEEECLNLGAVDFLPKPYPKPGIIKARVKRTIELFEDRLIIKSTERDHLTNLYNPMYFYQYVLKLDEYYKNTNMDAVIIDIRHFHMINDRFGFNYGDNVLKDLAKKIKLKLKDIGGIVSRMDKDIFMVYLLHQESYDDFILNIKLDNNISIRIGVYENVDKTLEPSIRFDMAKIACNQIRNNMSKSVCYYDISLREKELFEERLINDFDNAIKNNEFVVYYQPKFNVKSNNPYLASAEALVRWNHKELGFISPGVFIPLFEANGLIEKLDHYVWDVVAKKIKYWKDTIGYYVPISVNVSRINMYNDSLVENIVSLIKDNDLDYKDIYLEITESAYTNDSKRIVDIINKLRSLGFIIEMDDFGTGYSSLNMINELPIDVLKLDMSFVRKASINNDTKIIEVIIGLAKYINVPVIAEGVETKEQLEMLKNLGCEYIQGYYFSKPICDNEFESFIIERMKYANN